MLYVQLISSSQLWADRGLSPLRLRVLNPRPKRWPQYQPHLFTQQISLSLIYTRPSLVAQLVTCKAGDPGLIPESGRSAGGGIGYPLQYSWASLEAQLVMNLPAMRIDLGSIPGLGRSPMKGKAIHSSILAWRIPWTV